MNKQLENKLQGQKVLLVDDDPSLLKLLALRIHATGLEVKTVEYFAVFGCTFDFVAYVYHLTVFGVFYILRGGCEFSKSDKIICRIKYKYIVVRMCILINFIQNWQEYCAPPYCYIFKL